MFKMKSLYESLLDDDDKLFDETDAEIVNIYKYIEENYTTSTYKKIDLSKIEIIDKYNVNYNGKISSDIIVLRKTAESLTGGFFKWNKINGSLHIYSDYKNKLKSLEGGPEEVTGSFICEQHSGLTTLKGAPKKVGGTFSCYDCASLKSLEGAPEEVGGDFNCVNCSSLKTLEGSPKEVGGNYNCMSCYNLKSLKGIPKIINGSFSCKGTNQNYSFYKDDIEKMSNIKGKIMV